MVILRLIMLFGFVAGMYFWAKERHIKSIFGKDSTEYKNVNTKKQWAFVVAVIPFVIFCFLSTSIDNNKHSVNKSQQEKIDKNEIKNYEIREETYSEKKKKNF